MSEINNGGPAFPVSTSNENEGHQDGPNTWQFPGMTLRDYFAAKAMPAVYRDLWDDIRAGRNGCVPEDWKIGVALDAYAMADAMIAARASSARPAAEPEPAAPDYDGWIEWGGGECPVPVGMLVDVIHRSGEGHLSQPAGVAAAPPHGYAEDWSHDGALGDIVRYRVATEGRP